MRRIAGAGHSSFIARMVLRCFAWSSISTFAPMRLQNSRCIVQLISLLSQVAKDERALVAQDLVEVGNPLRQPGK